MKTLRLLLWLRWRLFLNSVSAAARWVSVTVAAVVFLALSPLWAGGAVLAWAGVERYGAPVITLAFAACQFLWLSAGLVSGALGRTFELDKFLRFPVAPRSVFVINVFASLLEPMSLMTAPTLGAVALAVAARSGWWAGAGAAFAGLLLALLTATVLQVLLALLDELLRRESTRYAAGIALPLVFLSMQFAVQAGLRDVTRWLRDRQIDPGQALESASHAFAFVPTVGAPAALATGAFVHDPRIALAGLAGSLVLFVLGIVPAAALMRHVVRAGEGAGGGPRARANASGARDRFAVFSPPLRPELGALLARELRYTLAHPQRVASMVSLPLVVVVLNLTSGDRPSQSPAFLMTMLLLTLGTSSSMLFGYDGAGVRSLFLLPCRTRDVVLSKNLECLVRLTVELVFVAIAMAVLMPRVWNPSRAPHLLAGLGVLFATLVVGTSIGIRFPTRARRRGQGMRGGPGIFQSLGMYFGIAALGVVVFGSVELARRLLPTAQAPPVAWAIAATWALAGVALWWRSLDVHAMLVTECRERILAEAARSDVE